MSKASESIRKIQEAARQRVLEKVGKGESPKPTSKPVVSDELVWIKAHELKKKVMSQVHTALADDFDSLKQEIVKQLSVDSVMPVDVVPNNCRFIFENSNGRNNPGIMILEFPPTTRIVNAYCSRKGDRGSFNIPFPYFYFIIHFNKIVRNGTVDFLIGQRGVGARTSPLKSLNDKIGCIPIPHTQGLQYICQSEAKAGRPYESLQDLATDVVNTFWRTQFAHEFVPFTVDKKKVNSWTDWEKLSALDMLKVVLRGQTEVQLLIESATSVQNNPLRGQIQNLVAQAERALQAKIKNVNFTKDIALAMKEIITQDSE